jgi:acetyl esterase/lipase
MALTPAASWALTYLYVAAATPWFLSRFVLDVVLYTVIPWSRPSRLWSLNQAVRVRVVRLALLYFSLLQTGDRMRLKPGREGNRFQLIPASHAPKLYRGPAAGDALIRPGEVGATWTPARPSPKALSGNKIIVALHIHGGGFVLGDGRDKDAGFFARTLIDRMGCTYVCAPQYRLACRGGEFPAPLQDAITAYLYLIRDLKIPGPQILFSGDSAGGNIVIGLLRYISECGEELDLPLPGGVALWSPWTDVGGALSQDINLSPNVRTDYINGDFGRWGASSVSGFGRTNPEGPYLSPLQHPFRLAGVPVPVFVHAGGGEVLVNDIRDFCERYRKEGWNLELFESKGCPHDILLLGSQMGFQKEGWEAAARGKAFLMGASGLPLRADG